MKRSSTVKERKQVNVLLLAAVIFLQLLVTLTVLAENSSPLISNIVILPGSKVDAASWMNISVAVFDAEGISSVFAAVILPDGHRDDVALLPSDNNGNNFSGLFLNTSLKGIYSVEIIAKDSLNNIGASEKIHFSVLDNLPPSVSNVQNIEGSSSTQFDAMLILADIKDNFEVSAAFAEITLPNFTKRIISLVPFSGITYAGDFTPLELEGEHLVKIIANDSSNNINNLGFTSFTIDSQSLTALKEDNQVFNVIDLGVNSTDIQFSNSNPIEGEHVVVNATIHNFGDLNTSNVAIQFLDSGTEIRNTTINVSAFSTATILTNYTAKIGSRNIQVKIDPGNLIAESNEPNNNASRNISISAQFTFFGKATTLVGLGLGFDFLFDVQSEIKNIFITDSDSLLDFSSLQALGRKNDSGLASNDFTETDTVLGMGNFSDSVRNLFSIDGSAPKQTTVFGVYGSIIASVPIVNSTNSSTFVTGILWDFSDDTNGEFDSVDKEDLAFITKTNTSQVGSFGIYDYEIKIPALLRDYKGTKASVDMYFEVK